MKRTERFEVQWKDTPDCCWQRGVFEHTSLSSAQASVATLQADNPGLLCRIIHVVTLVRRTVVGEG